MKESQETQADENRESAEMQEKEAKEGTEEHNPEVISEEFQNQVMECCNEYADSKPCLEYMRDRANDALDKLREKEMKKKSKDSPKEFSTVGMP